MPAETIEMLREKAPTLFYALMGFALFAVLLGAIGLAFFLLIAGSAVHVARVGLEAA